METKRGALPISSLTVTTTPRDSMPLVEKQNIPPPRAQKHVIREPRTLHHTARTRSNSRIAMVYHHKLVLYKQKL